MQAGPSTQGPAAVPPVYADTRDPEIEAFHNHQRMAARPSVADEARTITQLAKYGVLSTISSKGIPGFPSGGVVEFAVDEAGRPLLATSTLSPHTGDLVQDGRCSLTVQAPGWKSLQDARYTLIGTAVPIPEEERAAARQTYLEKHPHAFYVDFGDFRWFRVEGLRPGRFNGGFARAATIVPEEYHRAQPDPVAAFSEPVAKHMNADHERDMIAMVKHYVGMTVDSASMLGVDRLGSNLEVTKAGNDGPFKLRLPFVRPAEDRKALKDVIVEMTKAAMAANKGASS